MHGILHPMRRPTHRAFVIFFFLSVSFSVAANPLIIFDTDFGGDADDLGALAMLHNMMRAGECELLAVMNWNTERHALPAIVAVNNWYGQGDIPVGARHGAAWTADWQYSQAVVEALDAPRDVQAPDATQLYRKILATAEDHSVTIVTVGPLANVLELLQSGPDQVSSSSGQDLVRSKVKQFVIMGGQFPSGDHEWNFDGDMPGVTRDVLAAIEAPVVFSGYEIGDAIRTGTTLNDLDPSHPLYAGYMHFSRHAPWMKERFTGQILDNASFDQTAVLHAVRGGVDDWWTFSEPGRVVADENGGNRWEPDPEGRHRFLVLSEAPETVAAVIRDAMLGPAN